MDALIREIENVHKDRFRYLVCRDEGTTGRFECTVFPDQVDDSDPLKGVLIFSKHMTNTHVHQDYEEFLDGLFEMIGLVKLQE